MSSINCIIVDDERLARLELRELLQSHPYIKILAEVSNGMEALPLIEEHKPDLLFLDIQMPGWSGFDLLEQLNWIPKVIFTTAYDQYAVKAFEVNALDYILKPINPDRLAISLQNFSANISKSKKKETKQNPLQNKQIFIKDGDFCHFILLSDISYLKTYDNYVRLYFNSTSAMIKKSMNTLEDKLQGALFFRCNRAEMINLEQINTVESLQKGKLRITLKTGEIVVVSERKSILFREKMGL